MRILNIMGINAIVGLESRLLQYVLKVKGIIIWLFNRKSTQHNCAGQQFSSLTKFVYS